MERWVTRIETVCRRAGIISQASSGSNAIVPCLARKIPTPLVEAKNSTRQTAQGRSFTGREALCRGSQGHER